MRFEKNLPDRRSLVRRLEALTGETAIYTQLPRCAYEIGPFTVEKDGTLSAEITDDTKPVLQILLREGAIVGELPQETVWTPENASPSDVPSEKLPRIVKIRTSQKEIPTVQEWFYDDRCDYERNPAGEKTRKLHVHLFEKVVQPVMGDTPLNEVSGSQVDSVYRLMEQMAYAPNTINGVYEMMAMIFNSAIRAGIIQKSPTAGHLYPTGRIIRGSNRRRGEKQRPANLGDEAATHSVCPICGKEYNRPPALSRKDNQTLICPDCGTREALQVLNLPEERIEEILHQARRILEEDGYA